MSNELRVEQKKGESEDDALARAMLDPRTRSALTIEAFTTKGMKSDLCANISRLRTLCKDDNFKPEDMLIAQAHTLDAMFNRLAGMAMTNLNNVNTCKTLLDLALRS